MPCRRPEALPDLRESAISAATYGISYDRVGEWAPRDPLFFITRADPARPGARLGSVTGPLRPPSQHDRPQKPQTAFDTRYDRTDRHVRGHRTARRAQARRRARGRGA